MNEFLTEVRDIGDSTLIILNKEVRKNQRVIGENSEVQDEMGGILRNVVKYMMFKCN